MTAVAVSDSNNSREDFEGSPSFTSIVGGAGAGQEAVTYLEGSNSGSRKVVSSSSAGFWVNTASGVDMTSGDDRVWLAKIFLSDFGDLNSTGLRLRLGADTSNYYEYLVHDDGTRGDIDYPPLASWRIIPIDPNVVAWRDFVTGSPSLTAVDEFAVTAAVATGAAKAENLFMDAIDLGDGLYLVSGDGSDADGVWFDFVNYDQNTLSRRFGHFFEQLGIIFLRGKAIIGRTSGGSVTATEFTDTNAVIVIPESRVDNGWNEIEADIGNASTSINLIDSIFLCRGNGAAKHYFGTSAADTASDTVAIWGASPALRTGDAIIYSKEGGSANIGLTDATRYWIRIDSTSGDDTLFTFHTNRDDAYTNTSPVNLTNVAGVEEHSIIREIDSRGDFTQTGTSGSLLASGCTFENFRNFLLRTNGTLSAKIINAANIDLTNSGILVDADIQGGSVEEGNALVVTDDLELISDCTFSQKDNPSGDRGHAIEISTAGTYDLSNVLFNNYGIVNSFDTEDDVDGGTEQITISGHTWETGQAIYYGKEGGTESIGLTDGNKYYINKIDANTIYIYLNRTLAFAGGSLGRVNLTASGAGNGETHWLYAADCEILNSSGGSVTINIVGTGDVPNVRNTVGSSTTVNANTQITLTGLINPTEVRVYTAGTTTELDGQEDVTGGTFSFSRPQGTDVDIRIYAIQYLPADILNFTIPSTDTTIPITQFIDRNLLNP